MSEELCLRDRHKSTTSRKSRDIELPQPSNKRPTPAEASPTGLRPNNAASTPGAKGTNIVGGGTSLPPGDQPGDPWSTLFVIAGDGLLGEQPWSKVTTLPPLVEKGLLMGLTMLEGCRCVVMVTGGPHLTQALMEEVVRRVPGGIDSFGPGRAVEALFKERAAPCTRHQPPNPHNCCLHTSGAHALGPGCWQTAPSLSRRCSSRLWRSGSARTCASARCELSRLTASPRQRCGCTSTASRTGASSSTVASAAAAGMTRSTYRRVEMSTVGHNR